MGIFNRKQTTASLSSFDNKCTVVELGGSVSSTRIDSKYIYDGCEFVGNYIDQKIRLAYKAPLQVKVAGRVSGSLSEEYRAMLFDLKRAMRLFLIHGEVYFVYLPSDVWYPVSPRNVKKNTKTFEIQGIKGRTTFLPDEVKRIFNPHDDDPQTAYSEFQRVQHDIIRYWKLQEELAQNVDSLALRYGGIYLGEGTEDVAYYAGTDDGVASQVSDNQDMFGQWLKQKKAGINTAILYEGPIKPEPFMLSELLDERSIMQKKDCVDGFARGVNWPRALLMEGEGQGKYANEELLQRAAYENYVVPFLDDFAERLTVAFFETSTIKFCFGWDTIVQQDSKIELMLEAKKAGVMIDDDVILKELGIDTGVQTTAAVQADYIQLEQDRANSIMDEWEQGVDEALIALWLLRKKGLTPAQQRVLMQLPIERRFTQLALDSTVNASGLNVSQSATSFMGSPQATQTVEKYAVRTVERIKPLLNNPVVSDDFKKMFMNDLQRVLTIAERDATFTLVTPERIRSILDSDGGLFANVPGTQVQTYRWVHGFFRTPIKPFQAHVERNGMVGSYDSLTGNGSIRPQDHKHCTCILVPEV